MHVRHLSAWLVRHLSAGVIWACVPGEVAGNHSSYQAAEPAAGSPEHRQQFLLWRWLRQLHNGGLRQAEKVPISPHPSCWFMRMALISSCHHVMLLSGYEGTQGVTARAASLLEQSDDSRSQCSRVMLLPHLCTAGELTKANETCSISNISSLTSACHLRVSQ